MGIDTKALRLGGGVRSRYLGRWRDEELPTAHDGYSSPLVSRRCLPWATCVVQMKSSIRVENHAARTSTSHERGHAVRTD